MPNHQTTLTLDDVDAAAKDAFDMFVAHRSRLPRWDALNEPTKDTWRRIALRTLGHVVTA